MDGNGRWAKRRMLPRVAGHREGVKRVREIVRAAGEIGISYLTLFTFSAENWKRPKDEVEHLMKMLERLLRDELEELDKNNVRFQAIGRIDMLPSSVRDGIDNMRRRLEGNTGLVLILALNYGGRQEIVDMALRVARDIGKGDIQPDSVDEDVFAGYQYLPELPYPDLLIRTGSEQRISNFLLWQSAYTELYFTDLLWPEFKRAELEQALKDYAGRERRFGKLEG
ncbi:di-trans,poly-cis-decaprenylcistransferase [candidate division WOR-3 bacterium]|uniref:Isoprenyl transferase n=1 Tax=candidate division WOR-3 bacterium TaxID=2052148 RepID=A0A9D5QDN2_UNCW3|nr:di-trans,poly-cis-decaprenylcistransferase [candidate division WOR-3 bacterium]MBD3365262.1 di-trans,poly-cis-decaprenylcistransferase [candidate division WOR-3 bacterium]